MVLAAAPALVSLAVALGSCARQEESLIVTRALIIESPCTLGLSTSSALARGFVDLSFVTGYWAGFELKNNLIQQPSGSTSSGVDTSEMYIESVDVRLDTPQDSSIIDAVEAVDPALVDYNQILASNSFAGQDSWGEFVEVPQATMDALRNAISAKYSPDVRLTMTMNVTFHAIRASNKIGEVDAREFTLPVELCFDCLRDCTGCGAGCSTDESVGVGLCGSAQDGAVVPASCVDTMAP